jgi:hypothetical protein
MPSGTRQMLALRPAAVAVHDDGDVPRQPRQVQSGQQLGLFSGDGAESAGVGYGNGSMRFHREHGFQEISLYAAKLTHALLPAQRWNADFV